MQDQSQAYERIGICVCQNLSFNRTRYLDEQCLKKCASGKV